jgi:hypothetical protein
MNENLKATIVQKLDKMTDETGRQLLDYIEFLESKCNRSTRERSTFERLAENVEGTLRSSKIGEAAVKGTGGIIDVAGTVARSFAAAGQAVLDELQDVVSDDSKEKQEGNTNEESSSDEKDEAPGDSSDSKKEAPETEEEDDKQSA